MKFSVAAIITFKKKYLVQKRDQKKRIFYPGFYGLFGGVQEGAEKPIDTIKRELLEEINLSDLDVNKFIKIKLESNLFNPKNSSVFNRHIFICKLTKQNKNNIKINEGKYYKFFNINDIKKIEMAPFDKALISYYDLFKKNSSIIPKKYLIKNYNKLSL